MSNSENLDKNIRTLLNFLKKVIEINDRRRLNLNGQPNLVLSYLNKYAKAYSLSCNNDPNGTLTHIDYFLQIYKPYRTAILRGESSWLKLNNVYVQYGDGIPGVRRDIRILLSDIYLMAYELRKQAEYRLEGLPDKEWETCEELNFPDIILLHLYRIFREICPEDKDQLSKCIIDIEDELGISHSGGGGSMLSNSNSNSGGLGTLGNLGGLDKLIGPLLTTITKATSDGENGGLSDIGSLLGKLDLSSIMSSFTNTLQDPDTQASIQTTIGQLQSNPEIGKIFNNVSNAFKESNMAIGPPNLSVPVSTLQNTALSALESSSKTMKNSNFKSSVGEDSYI